jgi:tRNA-binding protein
VSASEELQRIEISVGRVVSVGPHPGARAPSHRLTIDFGERGRRDSTLPAPHYSEDELVGRQVVCSLGAEDTVVLAAHSHAHGLVLLAPEREVEEGTAVS